MDEKRTQSIADNVFSALENDILSGVLPKGALITELRACEQFGVSRTPVREALQRLRQEGLVEESGKGAVVIGITESDIDDIYEVRVRIEGLAAARCAERISAEELKKLSETVELQEFYTAKGDRDRTKEMDDQFHSAICRLCGHNVISDTLIPLHKKIQRYRRASIADETRMKQMAEEHRAIYDAIAAGDAEQAKKLTQLHVDNARANMLKEKVD